MTYRAPLAEYRFLLTRLFDFAALSATARFAHATPDLAEAVLTEAARLAEGTLAPLNRVGDRDPARLEGDVVRTPPGFADGFRALAQGGWVAVTAPEAQGGMGLPVTLGSLVNEMFGSACLSLALNPLMSQGQIEALEHHATPEVQALVIPRLISGQWCATMNLTEPQAGSDVGALRTRAEALGDGSYAVTGQKIFITWADCDFAENIMHLVLARLPDGGEGTKGISLFLVPKFLPDAAGNPGPRNALRVVSLEHKLGLHGSPTAVMAFEGAKGWLVGAPHKGMAAMFTMMNNARLGVGVQGISIAEAACQDALTYAGERRQGRTPGGEAAIIGHPDVRRMLAEARAHVFSARAIALATALALDLARATGDAAQAARAAFLTPIAKAYGTDTGHFVAQAGIQVHGGMGFIEETGVAQYARDVRVTQIYEGTNGIQALDLVGRKLADGGEVAFRLIDEMQAAAEAARDSHPDLAHDLWSAAEALGEATEVLLLQDMADRQAGAVAYLRAFALTLGAQYHLAAALAEPARLALARVAIRRILPEQAGLLAQVREGADGLMALSPEMLGA